MKRPLSLVLGLAIFFAKIGWLHAAASLESLGVIQVSVVNSFGEGVPDAQIYVYGRHATALGDVRSGDNLRLPEGNYELAAAWIEKSDLGIVPHVSPHARVHVTSGDTVSVILPVNYVLAKPEPETLGDVALYSR